MSGARQDVRAWVRERGEDVLLLLARLVAVPSVTGDEAELARVLAAFLGERGVDCELVPCKGRYNLAASVGDGPRTLVLSGHLDTVPAEAAEWSRDPWLPHRADGRLYGLGSSDLKASIAACCYALLHFAEAGAPAGRLALALTIEEETTGDGTRELLAWAERTGWLDFASTACVVTEPTGLVKVSLGNKGCGFLVLTCRGLGGHGSRPHLARNPLPRMLAAVRAIEELEASFAERYADPDLGTSTLTPTAVLAGDESRTNVIPHVARAIVDCRVTPALFADDFALFRAELARALAPLEAEGFELTWRLDHARPGHKLDAAHPLAQCVMSVLRDELGVPSEFEHTPAGNDAVFFGERGIPTLNKVGPGLPSSAHRVDEYVEEETVLVATELYARVARRYLGAPLTVGP